MAGSKSRQEREHPGHHATTDELYVLANLEALNAEFLKMGLKKERRQRLNEAKKRHFGILEGRGLLE